MGPSFEQIVESSILPDDFDYLLELSIEELKRSICNRRVVNLLFRNIDRELSDLINKEDKLKETRIDAHRLWKFIESICEEDSDDEDQEEDGESLEECSTTTSTHTHPLVTPPEDQGAESIESAGSLVESVRPVTLTGQTGHPNWSDRSNQEPEEKEQEVLTKAIKTSTSFRRVNIFQ